jgi:4-hydroxy-tetrahydrodipicolinate synthase
MRLREKLRGTGVALVTPFKEGQIHWGELERVIEHVLEGGVEYLVCLGTTGESSGTSEQEHRAILDFTIKTNRERVPLLAGVFGGNNTGAMVDKIKSFNFDGIDCLLSSNPAYNKPSQEGIYQHYMALADATPLPIMIYNVPSRTSSNMSAETTLRLAHASDKFIAVKEASDDIYQIMQIIKGRPEHFLVLSGDDFLTLPVLCAGGDGVVSVMANAFPRPFTDMVRAGLRNDWEAARKTNLELLDLYKLLFAEGNPVGVKAALELLGVCGREVRLPLVPLSEGGRTELKQAISKITNLR